MRGYEGLTVYDLIVAVEVELRAAASGHEERVRQMLRAIRKEMDTNPAYDEDVYMEGKRVPFGADQPT